MKRKDIKQKIEDKALEIPLDILLTGKRNRNLTKKMQGFAVDLATGETKAQAYRNNYNTKGKAKTQGNEGSKLAKHPEIAKEVELITEALEAAASYTAGQLRGLVIGRLTKEAVDMDSPSASRISALKALGQVSEIAAFTERKEITQVKASDDIKAQLLKMIQGALGDQARTVNQDDDEAAALLAEIARPAPKEIDQDANPPTPTPNLAENFGASAIHSIPHTQSPSETVHMETFPGEGGTPEISDVEENQQDTEDTPVNVLKSQG